jgi:6,7-dimethyl-8-ribityllumazine synthase
MASTDDAAGVAAGGGHGAHGGSLKGIAAHSGAPGAHSRRVGIVHTQWNREVVDALVAGATGELRAQGVHRDNILVLSVRVPDALTVATPRAPWPAGGPSRSRLALTPRAAPPHNPSRRRRQVPGSYELPFGAKCLIDSSGVDAVLCIGCLIKGETMHFEYICEAVTQVRGGGRGAGVEGGGRGWRSLSLVPWA